MKDIYKRLDEILPKITEKSFRENKGLGNEIGYYIFDYEPQYEILVREHIKFLKKKVNIADSEIRIKEFNLYDVIIKILEDKGYLNKVFEMEEKKGSEKILKPIKNTLRLTQDNNLILDYIRTNIEKKDIVFITGVGKAWPIIRSHTILNSLHAVVDDVPLVMFFPGTYDGLELHLFDELKDDNYYRAFRLVDKN
ncbi:MAG: DUF1788 domain-containing protein [Halanaerobiales bacterium]|nr:DUF1788 domain-containing protein [Halanaerobiales bacterium]